MSAMFESEGKPMTGIDLSVAFEWHELEAIRERYEREVKPNEWIMIDRMDLTWPMVQRWYTRKKYDEELAVLMLKKAQEIKKSFMVAPRFDQGSWQVINEAYETFVLTILYKLRCNVVMTAGIQGADENSPMDLFGGLGIKPRGQKELGHQPHSVFLLRQLKEKGQLIWTITTGKDLPKRERFDGMPIWDFAIQYLALYYQ